MSEPVAVEASAIELSFFVNQGNINLAETAREMHKKIMLSKYNHKAFQAVLLRIGLAGVRLKMAHRAAHVANFLTVPYVAPSGAIMAKWATGSPAVPEVPEVLGAGGAVVQPFVPAVPLVEPDADLARAMDDFEQALLSQYALKKIIFTAADGLKREKEKATFVGQENYVFEATLVQACEDSKNLQIKDLGPAPVSQRSPT